MGIYANFKKSELEVEYWRERFPRYVVTEKQIPNNYAAKPIDDLKNNNNRMEHTHIYMRILSKGLEESRHKKRS